MSKLGPHQHHQFVKGFERALVLMLGTNAKWSRDEVTIHRRVARMLFGRKRTRK